MQIRNIELWRPNSSVQKRNVIRSCSSVVVACKNVTWSCGDETTSCNNIIQRL